MNNKKAFLESLWDNSALEKTATGVALYEFHGREALKKSGKIRGLFYLKRPKCYGQRVYFINALLTLTLHKIAYFEHASEVVQLLMI
ncbi:hypothetical protein JYT81_00620 [Gammaproteobacteria bacterium AH-315-K14]|nr:hypothetical protein [Gammaproteobacteria bacterium AH-315-K14]